MQCNGLGADVARSWGGTDPDLGN
eukprot:SAG11_NODE_12581_length_696_cov_0.948074_1_plen_23_part_10